ncbi:MAG: DUF192 domain-containing protein, partial [Hyphomicrobiaceae bacterium]
ALNRAVSALPRNGLNRTAETAVLLFLAAGLFAAVVFPSPGAGMRRETLTLVTSSGEHVINIEVAETAEEKAYGLMFRTSLAENAGMLFEFDPPQDVTMWMRNTYISLDMVFIRGDGAVHRVETRTEPLSERTIASQGSVTAVLELPAGAADRMKIKPGDRVRHPYFKTK